MKNHMILLVALSITGWAGSQPSTQGANPMSLQEKFKNPPVEHRMLQIIHPFPEDIEKSGLSPFLQVVNEDAAQSHWTNQVISAVTSALEKPAEDAAALDRPTMRLAHFLRRNGYGGVVANVSFDKYLEDENAWKVFLQGVEDCQKTGMRVWLYDEKGYPSGKAGGITMRNHPEFECEGIVCSKARGKGDIHLKIPVGERVSNPPMRIVAMPILNDRLDIGRKMDVAAAPQAASDEIIFKAPDSGEWEVMAFTRRRMYEGTHIVTNLSDRLPYINIMDREAIAEFLSNTHQAYRDRCNDQLWSHIEAIFTDEPSLMTSYLQEEAGLLPAIPWSRAFADEFMKRRGYDVRDHFTELFTDCGEASLYARMDFWKTVAELIEENYYKQIQDWCQANGIASTGHALLEEGIHMHAVFEGDLYRDLRRMDIPGIDVLSSYPHELARGGHIMVPKFVSSVTHMQGLKDCMSETSSHVQTVGKLPCSFEQKIGTINWMYVLGLTTVTSYYSPGQFNDEERRAFNDYIGRLGVMLTGGKHIAPVGVYYPIWSQWAGIQPTEKIAWHPPQSELSERVNRIFSFASRSLLASQIDYDFLDDQALLESRINKGSMDIQDESFSLLVLPETLALPLEVYQKIEKFVESGGNLVSVGNLPSMGVKSNESEPVQKITQRLSQSAQVKVVADLKDLPSAMLALQPPDVALNEPCDVVFYAHRHQEGRDIYFVSNLGEEKVSREVVFNCQGNPEVWRPMNGQIQSLEHRADGARTAIKLDFEPYEGCFVVFNH